MSAQTKTSVLPRTPLVREPKKVRQQEKRLNDLNFEEFLTVVEQEFLQHPIVLHNPYTIWLSTGEASMAEMRHFAKQFSVFSNQFLVAQLQKMINADSLEGMRSAKEILANEIGVIFRGQKKQKDESLDDTQKDREGDPELVSIEGSVDGGIFRFRAAHFEWLLKFAEPLGLEFSDLGKRKHGTASTLHFCDALIRVYGNEDASIAAGASFAIENWAARSGFWQEIEDGLLHIQQTRMPDLSVAFFTWHNRLEAQHAAHTQDELAEIFEMPDFDREKFLQGGREILEALAVFWLGLENDRLQAES